MLSLDCVSEQAAVRALGYTPTTWDNLSEEELQPWSSIKPWANLTEGEKAAATSLGYTDITWDNASGNEELPKVNTKYWVQLTACPDGTHALRLEVAASSCLCVHFCGGVLFVS